MILNVKLPATGILYDAQYGEGLELETLSLSHIIEQLELSGIILPDETRIEKTNIIWNDDGTCIVDIECEDATVLAQINTWIQSGDIVDRRRDLMKRTFTKESRPGG